jgi:hypothetical protein
MLDHEVIYIYRFYQHKFSEQRRVRLDMYAWDNISEWPMVTDQPGRRHSLGRPSERGDRLAREPFVNCNRMVNGEALGEIHAEVF